MNPRRIERSTPRRVPPAEQAPTTRAAADAALGLVRAVLGFVWWFFLGGHPGEPAPHRRRVRFWVIIRVGVLLGLGVTLYTVAHSLAAVAAFAALGVVSVAWFVRRRFARARLFEVASCPVSELADVREPLPPWRLFPWFALAVLTNAVVAARVGDRPGALRALEDLDVEKLTADERCFEEAVLALVAKRWGDKREAVRRALAAFPTGALALDEDLARITVEDVWHDAHRLAVLADSWDARDTWPRESTAIGRFRHLIDLKLKRAPAEALSDEAASSLLEEARALGDVELCAELSERPDVERGYRS